MNFKNIIGVAKKNFRDSGVQDILARSSKAICGVFEREVTVTADKVASTKLRLKNKGFVIIGTSEPIGRTRKIWFIPAGANI